MRPFPLLISLFLFVSVQFLPAQQLQLLGPKVALGINSNGIQSPYVEVAALSYISFGKRIGVMPELGLKNYSFFYTNNLGRTDVNHTILFAKVNAIYGIVPSHGGGMPTFFASTGYSLKRLLFVYENPEIITGPRFATTLFSRFMRFQQFPFIGLGYSKRIANSAQIIIHPEFSPDRRGGALGASGRAPWEVQLNISCLWQI
jgi:hypothetical protein